MMPPTCPKCHSQYKEIDNFCMDCGENLKAIRLQKHKKKGNGKR